MSSTKEKRQADGPGAKSSNELSGGANAPVDYTMTPIEVPSGSRDFVTVVQSADGTPANKVIKRDKTTGAYIAKALASKSVYSAVTVDIHTPERMAELLAGLTSAQSYILGFVPGIPVDEPYLLESKAVIKKRLGLGREDDTPMGIYNFSDTGVLVVGRFIDNFQYSTWRLFDVDKHRDMPDELGHDSFESWREDMIELEPTLAGACMLVTRSTKSRVLDADGEPVFPGATSLHVLVQSEPSTTPDDWRDALKAKSKAAGKWFTALKYGKADGKVCGKVEQPSLYDQAAIPGTQRLVFDGAPSLARRLDLTVSPADVVIHPGGRWDAGSIAPVSVPESVTPFEAGTTEAVGERPAPVLVDVGAVDVDALVAMGADSGREYRATLTCDTVLDTERFGQMTVREFWLGDQKKVRCQSLERESDSNAAFLGRFEDGMPFVYDIGLPDVRYVMADGESLKLVEGGLRAMFATGEKVQVREWATCILDAGLDEVEVAECLTLVVSLGGSPKQAVNAAYKEIKTSRQKKADQKKANAAFKMARGGRREVYWDAGSSEPILHHVEDLINADFGNDRVLVLGTSVVRAVDGRPRGFHQIDHDSDEAPKQMYMAPYTRIAMQHRLERSAAFWVKDARGNKVIIAAPAPIADGIREASRERLPVMTGLAHHPVITGSGVLVDKPGYDEDSGLLLDFDDGAIPAGDALSQDEAVGALAQVRSLLFSEVAFASSLDEAVGLAALLTGIERRVLPIAPGFVFGASVQATGKTTLARIIHIVLANRDLGTLSFADEVELGKAIPAGLATQPVSMVYDNIDDGTTLRSGVLANALTTGELTTRQLGESANFTVLTNALFIFTGNNLTISADLAARLRVCRLDASCERPDQRSFVHNDLLSYVKSVRGEAIGLMLSIVAGFFEAGCPMEGMKPSRFPAWDRLVRGPLIWAGAQDPDVSLDKLRDESPDIVKHRAVLGALRENFEVGQWFTAGDVARLRKLKGGHYDGGGFAQTDEEQLLNDVFDELVGERVVNAKAVSYPLKELVGKPFDGHVLRSELNRDTKRPEYKMTPL